MKHFQVEEVQGLYGPFSVSERVLQKLWGRQHFAPGPLCLLDGTTLEVIHPGTWNHLEGPDFRNARLKIDGREVVGDVEVHFYPEEWFAHNHGDDPHYRGVVLHAVLFRSMAGVRRGNDRTGLPTLVLGDHLAEDLESFSMDDALLEMVDFSHLAWADHFLHRTATERFELASAGAWRRWENKVGFAVGRLKSETWDQACHSLVLEVLGYPRNRAPMARLALRHPFAKDAHAAFADPDAIYAEEHENWRSTGQRPASHPRKRLLQYARLLAERPEWPRHLRERLLAAAATLGNAVPEGTLPTTPAMRRSLKINPLRKTLSSTVFAGVFGSSKLDTIIVDALLPLVAASAPGLIHVFGALWMAWPAGTFPDQQNRFIRQAMTPDGETPSLRSNGLSQGTLALFLTEGGTRPTKPAAP